MEHFDWLKGFILPNINFLIFFALAIYFFRKPARDSAKKHREAFEKQMADSRAARDAAVAKLEELKRREAALDREVADMKAMAREAAEQEARKIEGDAQRLAAHMKAEAQRIAAAEVEKAKAALGGEIVAAVQEAVTSKIRSEMTPEAQLSLVRNKISDLQHLRAEG